MWVGGWGGWVGWVGGWVNELFCIYGKVEEIKAVRMSEV